jgi:hypothetical protein
MCSGSTATISNRARLLERRSSKEEIGGTAWSSSSLATSPSTSPSPRKMGRFTSYQVSSHTRSELNKFSEKNKEVVGVVQSATEQNVDIKMSKDGNRMWALSECGQVMTYDLRKMEPVHSFQDMAGCTSLGKTTESSPCSTYSGVNDQETMFSVGSTSGLINIYDETCMTKEYPDSTKTLKNLRAPVTFQKYNSTGELAIFGSELLPDQARLLHCHSQRYEYSSLFSFISR